MHPFAAIVPLGTGPVASTHAEGDGVAGSLVTRRAHRIQIDAE